MSRRWPAKLVAAIIGAAVLGACGGSGSENATPTSTTRPTDTSRAALLPLRTSDLPTGFAAVDVRSTGAAVMVNQCVPALLTAGAAQIGETFLRNNDEVSSQSYVLANANAARDVIATLASSDAQTCLLNLLQQRFDSARAAQGLQDIPTTQTASGLDPATAQFRTVAVRNDGSTVRTVATGDLLLSQSDRSVTAVWLMWFDGSPDQATETALVTALRARATAAFAS